MSSLDVKMKQEFNISLIGVVVISIFLALLFSFPWWLSGFAMQVITRILIYSLLTLSFSFLIGQANILSLAQVGFFGISGYLMALLSVRYGLGFPYPPLIGFAGAILAAAIFGFIALRATGLYHLMITLAFSQIIWSVARQWVSLTQGTTGIRNISPIILADISFSAPKEPINFYYLVVGGFLFWFGIFFGVYRSSYGLALRALREDPDRLNTLGYSIFGLKYSAFILAGGLAGFSGILSTYFDGIINPSSINMSRTVWALMVSILGGIESLLGPIVGTSTGILLERFAEPLTERYMIVVGGVFIIVVLTMPEGIIGYLRRQGIYQYIGTILRKGTKSQLAEERRRK